MADFKLIAFVALWISALFAVLFLFSKQEMYNDVVMHERAHMQIDKYFGCSDTNYSVSYWDSNGVTTCYDKNFEPSEMYHLAHSINEAVGYNINGVVSILLGIFYILSVILVLLIFIVLKVVFEWV